MSERHSVEVLRECIDLQNRKANDYQNKNSKVRQADHYRRGVDTIHDMIHQKVLRAQSLLESDSDPNFESLEDTYKDIINYASFAVSYMRGKMEGQEQSAVKTALPKLPPNTIYLSNTSSDHSSETEQNSEEFTYDDSIMSLYVNQVSKDVHLEKLNKILKEKEDAAKYDREMALKIDDAVLAGYRNALENRNYIPQASSDMVGISFDPKYGEIYCHHNGIKIVQYYVNKCSLFYKVYQEYLEGRDSKKYSVIETAAKYVATTENNKNNFGATPHLESQISKDSNLDNNAAALLNVNLKNLPVANNTCECEACNCGNDPEGVGEYRG